MLPKNKDTKKNGQSLHSEMGLGQLLEELIFPYLHIKIYQKVTPNHNHVSLKGSSKGPFWVTVRFLKTPKLLRSEPNIRDFIKKHARIHENLSKLRNIIIVQANASNNFSTLE